MSFKALSRVAPSLTDGMLTPAISVLGFKALSRVAPSLTGFDAVAKQEKLEVSKRFRAWPLR